MEIYCLTDQIFTIINGIGHLFNWTYKLVYFQLDNSICSIPILIIKEDKKSKGKEKKEKKEKRKKIKLEGKLWLSFVLSL